LGFEDNLGALAIVTIPMIRTITKYINNKKLALKGPLGKMKDIYTLGIHHQSSSLYIDKAFSAA